MRRVDELFGMRGRDHDFGEKRELWKNAGSARLWRTSRLSTQRDFEQELPREFERVEGRGSV